MNPILKEKLFKKFIHSRCENGVWCSEPTNLYLIPHTLNLTDNYGQWQKDLFYGHMKVFLKMNPQNETFCKSWKISEKFLEKFKIKFIHQNGQQISNNNETDTSFSDHIDINDFLHKLLTKHQKLEFENQLKNTMHKMYINSLNDLTTLPPHSWENLKSNLGPVIHNLLITEVQKQSKNSKSNKNKNLKKTEGEIEADFHKIKRFLFYETKIKEKTFPNERYENLSYLDKRALKAGFEEQRKDDKFDGGPILTDIEKYLEENFATANLPGKTCLCEIICRKAGIELIVEPLSSSELNRSKVGETEQLLMALFQRAEALPHLMCCIAIDEIDALTPKRNEKSGEHKVDVLCLLLSLIGGIKDIKNVFVIASTNRLNKMDEAFCRRLQIKFFVGRLDPEKRLKIILKLCEIKLKSDCNKKLMNDKEKHEFLKKLTTNFSGAAVESFRSRIISYLIKYENPIDNEALRNIADRVAIDFQIMLGSNTIPILIEEKHVDANINNKITKMNSKEYTGKILIDLSDEACGKMQIEYTGKGKNGKELKRIDLIDLPGVNLTHDVIPTLVKLSIHQNVDFIQMFDTSMLLSNAAFDDNTVMECVMEKLGEWQQYPRSMAIFDVDSLIGVSENMSDSSMGQSNSYSITNNRLWQQVVIQTANSKLNDNSKNAHKWVVVISKNQFICKLFKSLTRFPLSESEIKENEDGVKERRCINCEIGYTNAKNSIDSCSFHDGPLIDIRVTKENIIHLDKKSMYKSFVEYNAHERQDMLKNFAYLCCFQSYNSTGCKKNFHSDVKDNRDLEKYRNYF
ncbi:ribosome biogenesis ATPase RIX7 [Brachionus plicatilis]|uniref:Ribosome biogenesis ATPase RIX7 n=1 Tax=Brachionus plicatilis TaxID=10195 RepID=A0A3M7SQA9_BRAPC|nr:ribosome biogenesis ATPase RIX7 [Brachionus plicatilis]